MTRGFEENVPRFRPRVRLGRALDEQLAQAEEVAQAEALAQSAPPAPAETGAAEVPAPEPPAPEVEPRSAPPAPVVDLAPSEPQTQTKTQTAP
ncbi:MAG TPA: hypothetical protein VIR81_15960, partial [Myxococcales bacterium]